MAGRPYQSLSLIETVAYKGNTSVTTEEARESPVMVCITSADFDSSPDT